MVAVRSAHLNPSGDFAVDEWVAGLGLANPHFSEQLAATWRYCEQRCLGHVNAPLLLWRSIEMVEILSMLSMDNDSLCAALLFPMADAGVVEEAILRGTFGKSITNLVHGVRNIEAIRKLKANHNDLIAPEQGSEMHRMLLAIVEDFRCVVIKLAERIAHLRELRNAPKDEQVLAAKEGASIYAPLANRLGIGQLKWELEDFCFRYLHPYEYKSIAELLHERRIDREQYIEEFVDALRQSMQEEGLKADIYGRPKHIYSIWRKMQNKTLAFSELFDVRAVRVVVERLQDCYVALRIIHALYDHLPDEFDDYVANPKPNGYQSIHTVIFASREKPLEIQIRAHQMHADAERGIAAHWKYKEGRTALTGGRSSHEEHISWLRQILT
ncbi:guanosine polyphosphate synthetase/pyrophosphohydrolase [secondary endosymbiont of Ctenarytaina eucalypti]|uniref:Guanosine polyphosphate synthetase/pyrophosphohydrolase n=1 Tax=secondary endosymbiont of Ctenarytaina eucalypti TaxID=1199245 RepID=J3TWY5_9ENTR|nr:guanosine polyphosphate synthetase/pyrophosphohydrolase [secondary endosymbiont of Ctenarytaina eucalypti]